MNQEYNVLTIIDEKKIKEKIVELKCDRRTLADWTENNLLFEKQKHFLWKIISI